MKKVDYQQKMPVANIVDKRSNPHDVVCSVMLRDSCCDNIVLGATQFVVKDNTTYLGIRETHVKSAIAYVNQEYPHDEITIFLSDPGTNYYDYLTIFQDDDGKYYLVEKKTGH